MHADDLGLFRLWFGKINQLKCFLSFLLHFPQFFWMSLIIYFAHIISFSSICFFAFITLHWFNNLLFYEMMFYLEKGQQYMILNLKVDIFALFNVFGVIGTKSTPFIYLAYWYNVTMIGNSLYFFVSLQSISFFYKNKNLFLSYYL